jgi:tetratricopeptide (TPR) repeat protein
MERGDLDAAADYFNRALQYTPQYAYLHVNLGILNGLRGDREAAERHFRLGQRYAPENPVSYLYYGRWLHKAGRDEEAASTVRRAVELSPANVAARHLLLDIAGEQRDWALVATLARETLGIEPDDSAARSWLARAGQSGRYPEQPVVRTRPPAGRGRAAITAEQWVAISLVQYRAGEYEDARRSSEEALRLQPDSADAFNNVCASENAMGEFAKAAAACRRALEIRPDFTLARNNLAWAASRQSSGE